MITLGNEIEPEECGMVLNNHCGLIAWLESYYCVFCHQLSSLRPAPLDALVQQENPGMGPKEVKLFPQTPEVGPKVTALKLQAGGGK